MQLATLPVLVPALLALGAFTGFCAGLLGVGGGMMMVPFLTLLFTALGSRFVETNPNHPFPSLTVQIFTYATGPYQAQKEQAWAGILVLIALIFCLNVAIRLATRGKRVAA